MHRKVGSLDYLHQIPGSFLIYRLTPEGRTHECVFNAPQKNFLEFGTAISLKRSKNYLASQCKT